MGSEDSARFNGQGEDGRSKKTEEDEEVEREKVLGRSCFF